MIGIEDAFFVYGKALFRCHGAVGNRTAWTNGNAMTAVYTQYIRTTDGLGYGSVVGLIYDLDGADRLAKTIPETFIGIYLKQAHERLLLVVASK